MHRRIDEEKKCRVIVCTLWLLGKPVDCELVALSKSYEFQLVRTPHYEGKVENISNGAVMTR